MSKNFTKETIETLNEEPSSESIREEIHDRYGLGMRELYALRSDDTLLYDSKYNVAVMSLGKDYLEKRVAEEKALAQARDVYLPILQERILKRTEGQSFDELDSTDRALMVGAASEQVMAIWSMYYSAVHSEMYGYSYHFLSHEPVPESKLFPENSSIEAQPA
jgi:hypothetical protein